jgi:hypothetical protein
MYGVQTISTACRSPRFGCKSKRHEIVFEAHYAQDRTQYEVRFRLIKRLQHLTGLSPRDERRQSKTRSIRAAPAPHAARRSSWASGRGSVLHGTAPRQSQSRLAADRPPPRFSARARSHSLARKCFSDVSRNDRNLPRSGRAAARSFFSKSRCEEGLREVLSFVRLMPPPAHKRVKR